MRKKRTLMLMAVALVAVSAVSLAACGPTYVETEAVYTQGEYQMPASDELVAASRLPYSPDDIKQVVGDKDVVGLYKYADANYNAMNQSGSFVVTKTNIVVDSVAKGKFAVEQRSTYAIVQNPDGRYVQTVSGMQKLELGAVNLSGIASAFGYMNRSYYDKKGKKTYKNGGGNPDFTDETGNLAGATCKWNSGTEVTPDGPPSSGGGLTALEIAANDSNLIKKTMKKNGTRIKYYKYLDEEAYLYYLTGEQLQAGGAPKDQMWDVDAQTYSGYVIDFHNGKGNTDGLKNVEADYGRKWPWGGFGKSQYQMDYEVLDKDACEISTATDEKSGKKYYKVKYVWVEDLIDHACRYAKTALISDINQFVAPYQMKYTRLETTIEFWENGLYKSWYREEEFDTYADAIMLGKGTGHAVNSAREVFTYSDADTDVVTKFANDQFWKGFSSAG